MFKLILMNLGASLFILAILLASLHSSLTKTIPTVEIFYRWLALLPAGVTALYAFFMHAFFPDLAASLIGWQNSPFQFEVAIANLAFGIVMLASIYKSYEFRIAAVLGTTCWLWGDAIGHLYQMGAHHNFTVGNAGSWFWMDILIPFSLIFCLAKLRQKKT